MTDYKSLFSCQVIQPGDPDYDSARTTFYGGIDRHPVAIVKATTSTDIKLAIKLAQEQGIDLAIRSGGHSFAGHSVCDNGLVLDLSNLKDIDIDLDSQTAWIGTGNTAGQVTEALDTHGFVIGFGDTGSVGVGGITLGGGIGFLVRKFGLSIDNLLAAKVITADGSELTVDDTHHPDLFWAIRGGGGNFGVVTHFKFKLHTLEQILGGMLILPAKPDLLTKYMELSAAAPNELSSIINIMPAPPMPFLKPEHHGQMIMMAIMVFAGPPADGEQVLAPFRSLGEPLADLIKPMRYVEMFQPDDGSYHPTAVAQTMFLDNVNQSTAETILDHLNTLDAPMRVVQLRTIGGAMAAIPNQATAFAHRSSQIMANIASFYDTPENKISRNEWVMNLAKTLQQSDKGRYVNFLGPDDSNLLSAAYPGETGDRLREIKKKYDPTNVFRNNHNVKP